MTSTDSKKIWPCSACGKTFARSWTFQRHLKTCNTCTKCNRSFTTPNKLKLHKRICTQNMDLRAKRSKTARSQFPLDEEKHVITIQSAFNKNLITYFIKNADECNDLESFFTTTFQLIREKIEEHLAIWPGVSVNFSIDTQYENPISHQHAERNFKTQNAAIYENTDIEQLINDGIDKIFGEMQDYEGKGSGYTLNAIEGVVLNISKHNPLKAACNLPLPGWIVKTNSCDHRHNPTNNACFHRAILAQVPQGRVYNFTGISSPTSLRDVEKFEEKNKVAIFIFALDEESKLYPFAPSKNNFNEIIDLLLLNDGEHHHFVRIFEFERLIRSQLTKNKIAIAVCRRCFSHFDSRVRSKEEKLREHQLECINKPTRVIMPTEEDKILKFRNIKNQVRVPIVVYCDIESLLVPIATCEPPTVDSKSGQSRSFTHKIQEHQIMSFGMFVKSDVHEGVDDDDFNKIIIYTGPDAASQLLYTLFRIGSKVLYLYSLNKEVKMTDDEKESHQAATLCYLCQKAFTIEDYKVVDHNHTTGEYRGPAHNSCNLAARKPNFLPIFFHNGSGYDFKFLVRELGKVPGDIQVLANTEERFISFSKKIVDYTGYLWLRFLDSCRFLPSSLDSIVKTLARDQFTILPNIYQGRQLELLLRKGQMPYEYMTDWSKLEETSLPPKECFFSSLTESGITDEDYTHAQDVWQEFCVTNLKMYSELYLSTDVYLLAEVYENFRKEFLSCEYGLDPVHYYSIPGLAFDGMLKITGVELELLTDYDKLLKIQQGIRGGYTQVSIRHAASDDINQLCYIDANNLYGYASCQPLPISNFEWIDPKTVDLLSVSDNAETGYIAQVDIDIPERLHDYFNDYPPLPEQLKPPGSKYTKLVATLSPKKRYVVHYKMLQFAVAHGCELKAVHSVIGFRQKRWLAPFIEINTEKRKLATTDFAKDLYKLLNNANFGKTIEQIQNRIDMRLVDEWSRAEKLIASPHFQSRTIIENNLVAIKMKKTKIKYNKPIYTGFVILEAAKLKMLEFHYDVMLQHYGPDRLRLAYTDTDSLIYLIKTLGQDWRHEAFFSMGEEFDFSNLPSQHPCYSTVNKKVLGKFKDELDGEDLLEWIGLRAKMYAIKRAEGGAIKKAKGIKKSAVKNRITFDDYRRVLFEDIVLCSKFKAIRSFKQKLFTVAISKLSLSAQDDKRHILPDKINTLAHGHYKIMDEMDDST